MGKTKSSDRNGELLNDVKHDKDIRDAVVEPFIEIEDDKPDTFLLYDVFDVPNVIETFLFAMQQVLMSLSSSLSTALLVANVVCAKTDENYKARLLSTTLFISGLCSFLQNTIGVRLPLYQGPAATYVVPLLALAALPEWKCPDFTTSVGVSNMTWNFTDGVSLETAKHDIIMDKTEKLEGSLMVAGLIHMLVGLTGIVGFLLRFIGPITVVPALTITALVVYRAIVGFAKAQWGIALLTTGTAMVLSFYLRNRKAPVPMWSKDRGFYIKWSPIQKMFSVLIACIVGWGLSGILTSVGAFSDDPTSGDYFARTDSRLDVIRDTKWFILPYPGQFGPPRFETGAFVTFIMGTISSVIDSIGDYYACAKVCSVPPPPTHAVTRGQFGPPRFETGAFVTFIMGTISSVIDSIGDYYACAKVCSVPPPPTHAVTRGIAIEGFMSFLGGWSGTGHATSTFGGNIGAIGITRVASLRVFQMVGLIFIIFGLVGKVGAAFVTIPYSVIGGMMLINFGILIGVMLSNLQFIDLNSNRNLAIIGISMLMAMMTPYWVQSSENAINTGLTSLDEIIRMLLGNPVFVAGFLACFMDNTCPGTPEERGMIAWKSELQGGTEDDSGTEKDNRSNERLRKVARTIYTIPFADKLLKRFPFLRYIPVYPR